MNPQTIGILLICAGMLWGVFEIFRRIPNGPDYKGPTVPKPEPEDLPPPMPEPVKPDPVETVPGGVFFLNLLIQIDMAYDPEVRRHLIEAGKSALDSYSEPGAYDGDNPTS